MSERRLPAGVVSDEAITNNGLNVLWYVLPGELSQALAAAEPAPVSGIRLAESVPNGDIVAVMSPAGQVFLRRKNRRTGQDGSETGSGKWLAVEPDAVDRTGWRRWRPI